MSDSSSFASSWPRSRGPLIVDEEEVDALVAEESIVTDDGILHTGGELSQVPSFDEGDGDLNDSFSTGSLSEDTEHNANDLQTESVSSSSQMVMNDSDTEDDSSDDSSIEVLEITRVHSFEKLVDVDGLKHLKATSSPSRDADGKLLASSSSLPKLQRLNDTYISANANEVPTSSSSSSIVGKDEWIPSKAYDATLTVGAMPSKSRGVRFRDANMTDLSVFCQKQPVAHPNKSMLPDMEFFFQLASDYIEGKDRPVKVDRQPFYNQLSSYKDYLEQRLKSTWVDVLHNFMLHLKVPLNQHREVIRFPSTCDIPDSTGKIENIILATPDYPVIKTFRQLPLYSFVMLLPKEIVSGKYRRPFHLHDCTTKV